MESFIRCLLLAWSLTGISQGQFLSNLRPLKGRFNAFESSRINNLATTTTIRPVIDFFSPAFTAASIGRPVFVPVSPPISHTRGPLIEVSVNASVAESIQQQQQQQSNPFQRQPSRNIIRSEVSSTATQNGNPFQRQPSRNIILFEGPSTATQNGNPFQLQPSRNIIRFDGPSTATQNVNLFQRQPSLNIIQSEVPVTATQNGDLFQLQPSLNINPSEFPSTATQNGQQRLQGQQAVRRKLFQDQQSVLKLFEYDYNEVDDSEGTSIIFSAGGGAVISTRTEARPSSDPELGTATSIPRGIPFSTFSRTHRRAAKDLCDAFLNVDTVEELEQLARRVRPRLNEYLFHYALSFVILHEPAFRNLRIPSVIEIYPNKFCDNELLVQAQNVVQRLPPNQTEAIVINQEFSGTLLKPEHRVSYWREDYGINAHHWHWHLVFPVEMGVKADRKGEIFYYLHQQMLARYDMERLSVGLTRVVPLSSFREPIEDGYFSKLTVRSGEPWGTRQDNTVPQDMRRQFFSFGFITLTQLEIWYSRMLDAVHQGYMHDSDGNRIPLSDDDFDDDDFDNGKRGIDILGDNFEADPDLSVNEPFYGDFHNSAHIVIAFAHDPNNFHNEQIGVLGDPSTSMRDPVFYRLHKFIDNFFQEYKLLQEPYSTDDLNFEGMRIDRAEVRQGDEINNLETGWNMRVFEASRGLDFLSDIPVQVNFTHLDHRPFEYHIQITNNLESVKEVTVRIFLAPKQDERGNEMNFMEQRLFWAEMDKFNCTVNPGANEIVRSSRNSSITSPPELTFRMLETPDEDGMLEPPEFGACGCGWPQHVLLPRGTPQGMDFQLFFMLTDWEEDRVDQPPINMMCSNAVSYCGNVGAKFPDRRPMGFPFDRRNPEEIFDVKINTAEDFADRLDNALIQDITITFNDAMLD